MAPIWKGRRGAVTAPMGQSPPATEGLAPSKTSGVHNKAQNGGFAAPVATRVSKLPVLAEPGRDYGCFLLPLEPKLASCHPQLGKLGATIALQCTRPCCQRGARMQRWLQLLQPRAGVCGSPHRCPLPPFTSNGLGQEKKRKEKLRAPMMASATTVMPCMAACHSSWPLGRATASVSICSWRTAQAL